MESMQQLRCQSHIVGLQEDEGKNILILDQTIFYPQGGGQPYDTGVITSVDNDFVLQVQEVRFVEGAVHHVGTIKKGHPSVGMKVHCVVDEERRQLHSRLHSAGHLVDVALNELKINWMPGKGYHFPDGPYVEYIGEIGDMNIDDLKLRIEEKCNEIISRGIKTHIQFDNDRLRDGKPTRTVFYGEYGVLCGGTHVSNLNEIVSIGIRKIKKKKDKVKVSYTI